MTSNSVYFTEDMHGFIEKVISPFDGEAQTFATIANEGEIKDQNFKFRLTINIENIENFINDKELTAKATGYIESPLFGGRREVQDGVFNLFVESKVSKDFDSIKEMHYTFQFSNEFNETFNFYAFKNIHKQDISNMWKDTTTLYTQIFKDGSRETPVYAGILRLNLKDFTKQMMTLNSNSKSCLDRIHSIYKFMNVFAGNLWEAYTPELFNPEKHDWDEHIFPVHTSKGVSNADVTHYHVDTEDGLTIQVDRFKRSECRDIVVLIHGLSNSTDMFIMPEHYNLVQFLNNNEYTDVFSIDWRGSGRHKYNYIPNEYTFDHIVKYDLPAAFQRIREELPENTNIHVIAHCIGSVAMSAALSSEMVSGIKSFISNSVSFTPQVHKIAKFKLKVAPFFLDNIFRYPYLSPQIPYMPGNSFAKWLSIFQSLVRRECKEPACHMASFMWGWGFPAPFEHKNLHPLTHKRIKDLFGATTTYYYRHISKMIKNRESVPFHREKDFYHLPESYLQNLVNVELPPTLLVSGNKNKIFPLSNKLSFEEIKKISPNQNIDYREIEGYGHQDIFIGQHAAEDIFPTFINFLNKNRA